MFPGQGAQAVGMLADLREAYEHIDERLLEASSIVGEDLISLITNGPSDRLNQTEITQPVLLATSVALFETWVKAGGPTPQAVAGHSLGEYSALSAAGVFTFGDAIRLVNERGKLMQSAVPEGSGKMAAVIGLELAELERLCRDTEGVVAPANINSPDQVVISGEADAVARVTDKVTEAGDRRKRVVPLDVSVPSHCELMHTAADGVARLLQETNMREPKFTVVQNFDADAAEGVEGIRDHLIEQLTNPVRWNDCMQTMAQLGCEQFVECGPGKVLTGLARRIDRSLTATAISTLADFETTLAELTR